MSARRTNRASDVDDLTYNPQGDTATDNAAYNPDSDEGIPVGARGADNQPTNVDAAREDREAERSEVTGKVSKGEVQELVGSTTKDERSRTGTRGKKNDPYKQERQMDRDFEQSGIEPAEQDIEISAATGRK
ncbi:hypothetical protein BV22DRAFT_1103356 [Leucogyrophana mollusca]|uniref:Uncharacterized protein n=1 Tax=Leucogyrophana mollusca TaxID=85980 RepID=A0ACB8BTH3_9AGAM|nr:hypothetical protein BV22DRAFT_1103356 [Leucogyrophana mollusca]